MAAMRFWVLGPVTVTAASGSVAIGGPRQRAVLALLLAHPDQLVPTADLVDGLWGEEPPPSAERTLHAYIARLRALIEPHHGSEGEHEVLTRSGSAYRLRVGPDELDSLAFEEDVSTARRQLAASDIDGGAVRLRSALTRWRGPAFADLLDLPSIQAAAQRLEQLRSDAVVGAVEADLALGRHASLVPALQNLVTDHPYDERLWAALALCFYRQGLQADALGAISKARSVLANELGIEPGRDLRALQAGILAGDPRLDAPARPGSRIVRDHPGLEGRDEAMVTLRTGWAKAAAGLGGAVVVSGPAGIGRSRLLRAFTAEVRAAGGLVLKDVDGDQVGIMRRALASSPGATCLLALDDVDEADPTAWRGMARIVDLASQHPVLVVLAVREGHIAPELGALLSRVDPTGERTVRLQPLAAEQIARVAAAYVGPTSALEAASAVATSSAGVPGRVHAELEVWARGRVHHDVVRTSTVASAEWAGARRGEEALARNLLELSAIETAASEARALALDSPESPWPGLAAFDAPDAAFFAGREELVAVAIARLAIAGSLVVVGASGAGKSSLVRAGMIPSLVAGALPESEAWQIDLVTPTGRLPAGGLDGPGRLLVVDQFEELLDLAVDARAALAQQLAARARNGTMLVLVARTDQYAHIAEEPRLAELLSAPRLHVGAMSAQQLARAVEVPAQRAGGGCTAELTAAVVADLAGEPGGLPLVSITMRRLWEESRSGLLTIDDYIASGGVHDAVARLAEDSYARLGPAERRAARVLLLRMAGPGDNSQVVRSFVPLASIDPVGPMHVALAVLTADRLVTADDARATVAHESLFTRWPRLAGWLAEGGEAIAARARLATATRTWVDSGRMEADLARGPRLAAASELKAMHPELLTADELAYVAASAALADAREAELMRTVRAQRRSNTRLRSLLAATLAAVLLTGAAAGVAVHLRGTAEDASRVATARGLGAEALITGRLDVSLLLAAQAASMDPEPQTRSDLIASLARATQARRVLVGTGQRLLGLATGGPGPRVVTLDRTGVATIFDVSTGRPLPLPHALAAMNRAGVAAAAFSPDRTTLALAGSMPGSASQGEVAFVDPVTLTPVHAPMVTPAPVAALGYGVGRLAVLSVDGAAAVFDTTTLRPVGPRIAAGLDGAVAIGIDRHARWVAAEGPFKVWDVASGRLLPLPPGPAGALAPDGSVVAVVDASRGNEIHLLARANGRVLRVLAGPTAPLEAVAFSADGTRLAAGSDDGSATVWDVASGQPLTTLNGHDGRVNAVAFAPDGRTLVTAGFDGRAVVWDLTAAGAGLGDPVGTLADIPAQVLSQSYVALSNASGRVLVGEPSGAVIIATAPSGGHVASFPAAHPGGVNDAEISRDGLIGATAGSDGTIRLWDLARGRPYAPVPSLRPSSLPASVAVSPDHRVVAWGDLTGAVTAASLTDGRILWHRQLDHAPPNGTAGGVLITAFSPDGSMLGASVSHVATALLPAGGAGPVRLLHTADNNTTAFAFSPDGTRLVTGDSDGSARLWNLATGHGTDLGAGSPAASGTIYGAAYDPGGDTVAVWAFDGSVRLWDGASAASLGPSLTAEKSGAAVAGAWQGDGALVTLQADGLMRRFLVSDSALTTRACAIAGRALTHTEWEQYLRGEQGVQACAP